MWAMEVREVPLQLLGCVFDGCRANHGGSVFVKEHINKPRLVGCSVDGFPMDVGYSCCAADDPAQRKIGSSACKAKRCSASGEYEFDDNVTDYRARYHCGPDRFEPGPSVASASQKTSAMFSSLHATGPSSLRALSSSQSNAGAKCSEAKLGCWVRTILTR